MMYQVLGILGVPIYESFSRSSCELFCKKKGFDPNICIVERKVDGK